MGFGIDTAPKALRYKWHPVAIFNLPPVPCNTLLSVKVTVLLFGCFTGIHGKTRSLHFARAVENES
jgi:hypothetical protein